LKRPPLPTFQQSPQPSRPYRRPQAITVPHRKNRYISNSHPKPKGRNPSRPGPASCNPVSRVTIDCHPPSPRAQSRRRRRTRLTPSSAYAPHTSDAPRYGRNGRIVWWELAQPVSICLTAPRSITCQVLSCPCCLLYYAVWYGIASLASRPPFPWSPGLNSSACITQVSQAAPQKLATSCRVCLPVRSITSLAMPFPSGPLESWFCLFQCHRGDAKDPVQPTRSPSHTTDWPNQAPRGLEVDNRASLSPRLLPSWLWIVDEDWATLAR
jgi:hypothetical protein